MASGEGRAGGLRWALVVVLGAACAGAGPESHVDAAELARRIEEGTAPTIVDVRSRGEYEQGHVPGALHVPFWAALSRASEIPDAGGRPIVVYCGHGPRAGLARAGLRLSGVGPVVYLEGHMSGWKEAGLPQTAGPLP